jgi:hypothetical protein
MVFGGARFTRPERRRAAPHMIDAEIRPPHKTLYEVLVVPPATSSRQIRRIARALRRDLPNLSDLDDVCLAEQVLGRRDLRAEYDALLARVRAAKLALPQIGAAIEGSRPAARSPARSAGVGGASAGADKGGSVILRVAATISALAIVGAGLGAGNRHRTDRYRPELPRIDVPRIDLPRIDVPRIDLHELGLDKVDPDKPGLRSPAKIELEKIELEKIELDPALAPRHAPPRSTPAKPRKADPAPLETR